MYPSLLEMSLYSFSQRPLRGPGFQIAVIERSFASAVCALGAFQIEGMLQKISMAQGNGDDRKSILAGLKNVKHQDMARELFVVRDVIAHGHIYKTTIQLRQDGFPKNSHSKKMTARESRDFKQVVKRNKTRLLGFNVNPSRIGFCDAVLALSVVNVIYKELENRPADMPINKVTANGYDSKLFSAYIDDLLKSLNTKHAKSVRNKLRKIDAT